MISKYDIKKAAESEKCWFTIDENKDVLIRKAERISELWMKFLLSSGINSIVILK